MIDRRAFLAQLGASSLCLSGAMAQPSLRGTVGEAAPTLRELAASRGFLSGCATASYQLRSPGFAAALAREAGILSAEYETKRLIIDAIEGEKGFPGTDALLAFAGAHGQRFRGHTLIWYAANPPGLEEAVLKARDPEAITGYVARVMGRYKGRVHSWDVVNEAIWPADGRSDGLRDSFWLRAFGPQYADLAFRAARKADPQAMLVYNDWGCEAGRADNDAFRRHTLNFLDGLLKRGAPIDAYGMQGHLSPFGNRVDQPKLALFLAELEARGLKLLITEMDVDDSEGPASAAARDAGSADEVRRFLDVVMRAKNLSAVQTWGLSDRFLKADARKLPLDRDLRPKPLYQAMARAFAARPPV